MRSIRVTSLIKVVLQFGLAIASVAVAACTAHVPRHPDNAMSSNGGDTSFKLAVLELDDSGELWNDEGLRSVGESFGELFESSVDEPEHLVVVYVHGWKNDASRKNEADGDLREFKQLMARVADDWQSESTPEERPVIGVYVGWRGDSVRLPEPLRSLSYFDRNAAASRVAGPPASASIWTIMRLFRLIPGTRIVVIGHSMGAKIVEAALGPAFHTAVLEYRFSEDETADVGIKWKPIADLVLLINPASPAIEAKKLIDAWTVPEGFAPEESGWSDSYLCSRGGERWTPLIISITSESDVPNRVLFPMGAGLATMLRRTRAYDKWTLEIDNGALSRLSPSRADRGSTTFALPSQRYFLTRTAGFAPVLHTHRLVHTPLASEAIATDNRVQPCSKQRCSALPRQTTWEDPEGEVKTGAACFRVGRHEFVVEELPTRYNNTPYWIMQVPRTVIDGHSGHFNEVTYDLVRALVTATPTNSWKEWNESQP
jgi:hypothetical protein